MKGGRLAIVNQTSAANVTFMSFNKVLFVKEAKGEFNTCCPPVSVHLAVCSATLWLFQSTDRQIHTHLIKNRRGIHTFEL